MSLALTQPLNSSLIFAVGLVNCIRNMLHPVLESVYVLIAPVCMFSPRHGRAQYAPRLPYKPGAMPVSSVTNNVCRVTPYTAPPPYEH